MRTEIRCTVMQGIVFLAVFFVAYLIQGITGFAGNIIAMPVGMATLGMIETVCVLNFAGFFGCGVNALSSRKHINWREAVKIMAVMFPFMLVGIWLDQVLSVEFLKPVYGAIVLAVGIRSLFAKRQRFYPEWALYVVLALAGLIQGMFVSGGAVLAIYCIQKLRDKNEFRGTLSVIWTVLNFIYMGINLAQGVYTQQMVPVLLATIPLSLLASYLGVKILPRISQESFTRMTYVLLVVIGVLLLVL
ncbi:MAG: sulfite exporter TauE/SafE family protein [Eggerthellales bacterium]|nr:sulfite exporter TauE/SafE family protein [Eggerthellales bacterium]